jgi:hypothetical protein
MKIYVYIEIERSTIVVVISDVPHPPVSSRKRDGGSQGQTATAEFGELTRLVKQQFSLQQTIFESQDRLEGEQNLLCGMEVSSAAGQKVVRAVAAAEAQLQETQRVLNIVQDRLATEARKQPEEGTLSHVRYKYCTSSEFCLTLLDVKPSLSAFTELVRESGSGSSTRGSVVCLVECALVDFRACLPLARVSTTVAGELVVTLSTDNLGEGDACHHPLKSSLALVIPDVMFDNATEAVPTPKLLLTLLFLPAAEIEVEGGPEALPGPSPVVLASTTVPLQMRNAPSFSYSKHKASATWPPASSNEAAFASEYNTTQLLTLRRPGARRGLDSLYLRVGLMRRPVVPFDQRPLHHMVLSVPAAGLSVIDRTEELLFVSFTKILLTLNDAQSQQTLKASVGNMQIDDQRCRALFPIVCQPTSMPPGTPLLPFLQLGVNKSKMPEAQRDMQVFQYVSLLLQEMSIKVDESLLFPLFKFVTEFEGAKSALRDSTYGDVLRTSDAFMKLDSVRRLPKPSQNYFVTLLVLQPVVLSLTFQANTLMRSEQGGALSLAIPLADLVAIDCTYIKFNCLMIHNARGTGATLVQAIEQHYYTQAMKELYKVVGAVEFLGNPIGLISDLGTGVMDFFYEPAKVVHLDAI